MIQRNDEIEKKELSLRGQGTVFVRPRSRILSLGQMRFLILILLAVATGQASAQAAERQWRNGELLDGVPMRHWPVWSRPGNDNVLSRVRSEADDVS